MIIEEGNYAAVIIAANEETGTTRDGKQWTRIRLYVDICRGVCKGYFTALKREYPKDRYKGTVDMYTAPDGNTDALTPTQQQQIATNLNLLCKYNGVDRVDQLPQDWTGLIVGIRVKKDEIGCATVSGWLVDGVDVTFADTVVSNFYNPNDDTQHTLFSCGKTYITYGYMCKEYGGNHWGADCIPYPNYIPSSADVVTIADGEVIYTKDSVNKTLDLNIKANWSSPDALGNNIKIRHPNGMLTRYCHLSYNSIKVKVGDKVKQGQVIAHMGCTGLSSGAHVHFEVWSNSSSTSRIDPEPYLLGQKLLYNTKKTNYVYKVTTDTKLYTTPSPSSPAVSVAVGDYLPCDYSVTIQGRKWLHTLSNCYVLASACKRRLISSYIIQHSTDYLNVRATPSTSAVSVGLISQGGGVVSIKGATKTAEGRKWTKIIYNNRICWVCADYLEG